MSCNSGTIVGTIVSDIQERQINDDLSVVNFRIAPCNARENDSPIPVSAYNEVGDRMFARLNKGDTVSISFRLRYNTWQTPEGEPRGRMEVIAYSFDTIRLGQISTAKRAEAALHKQQQEQPAAPVETAGLKAIRKRVAQTRTVPPTTQVATLEEIPF